MNKIPKLILLFIGLCCVSILLLWFKSPASSVLFKVSMFSFAGLMYLQAFSTTKLPISIKQKVLFRFGGIAMSVLTIGILFRLIMWQGWQQMIGIGGISVAIFAILMVFMQNKPTGVSGNPVEAENKPNDIVQSFWISLCFLALMSAIALLPSEKTIYETFSNLSKVESYEQFKAERNTNLNHHSDTTKSVGH